MTSSTHDSIYTFPVQTIEGRETSLLEWEGDLLLIVNTASECGFTPQYEGLESLWNHYKRRGLTVLGFPSNDFGKQEPGSNDEILEFCKRRFGVTFPLFQKGPVKGEDAHPLFRYLTQEANPEQKGEIKWNFEKFLIGREGTLLNRFSSRIKPESGRLTRAIESAL
ncbi:MAG: glutathione peroxidase [Bacteroidota bacterium]